MGRIAISALVFLVTAISFLSAQDDASIERKKALLGVTNPVIQGSRLFVGEDSNPSLADVVLLNHPTGYKLERIKSKRDGTKIQPEKLGDGQLLYSGRGKYLVEVLLLDLEKGIVDNEFEFEIGGAPPQPPQPDPNPEPDPDPDPDPPQPGPSPAPIPVAGFRVLIVYESSELTSLPASQLAALNSADVRRYLNSHCVKDASGNPEWRSLDQHTQFPILCDTVWCKTMARPRSAVPWIVISDGQQGYEGPFPMTLDETMALLRKYGGQ